MAEILVRTGVTDTGTSWFSGSAAVPFAGVGVAAVPFARPGEEKAPGRPYCGLSILKGASKKDGERLFSRACSNRTRGNGFKLKEGRFRLDIRKNIFTVRVVKHWNRMPGDVLDAPSLETFKVRLDGALSNLFWLKMSLLIAGGTTESYRSEKTFKIIESNRKPNTTKTTTIPYP
ncbi:hypothetical protein QYF61_018382 [Mycteria americana]|uniref:Uncharacterized protein n=1 Tax=Mycteria americana TaxID=33587 RepID=A0AAN7MM58_MYCAM|nr:hypothetical protein QYF61_018382 [Mycteria americana]